LNRPLLQVTEFGFYCEAGDFFLDPWRPVRRALVTHAHGDHLTVGCDSYLVTHESRHVVRARLGEEPVIETLPYGEKRLIGDVQVSFHPSGHILGAGQIRIEESGEVWVVSGDFKRAADATCTPLEPIKCHVFVTEATFALPIYRWSQSTALFDEINQWWRGNQEAGKASVLFAYALGKAQRILSGIDSSIGPILTHGAVERQIEAYRASGVNLPQTTRALSAEGVDWKKALIIAPPSARGSVWTRRFGRQSTALASGWMLIRGTRRRRAIDQGFALSDHADWPALLETIAETGAERVGVTHGYISELVKWLDEHGIAAEGYETEFEGEEEREAEPETTSDGEFLAG
jgi:putative mRNA 3-end processing factor